MLCCFFFKQKTAYEMRISDWSSDVCFSDLAKGMVSHTTDPDSYRNLVVPGMMHEAAGAMSRFAGNPSEWTYDQACNIAFNHMLAPNPLEIGRESRRNRVCQYV